MGARLGGKLDLYSPIYLSFCPRIKDTGVSRNYRLPSICLHELKINIIDSFLYLTIIHFLYHIYCVCIAYIMSTLFAELTNFSFNHDNNGIFYLRIYFNGARMRKIILKLSHTVW